MPRTVFSPGPKSHGFCGKRGFQEAQSPVPGFYIQAQSIEEMVDHTVGRALDLFDIDVGLVRRWGEESGPRTDAKNVRAPRRKD
jgi:hypothetical protein